MDTLVQTTLVHRITTAITTRIGRHTLCAWQVDAAHLVVVVFVIVEHLTGDEFVEAMPARQYAVGHRR